VDDNINIDIDDKTGDVENVFKSDYNEFEMTNFQACPSLYDWPQICLKSFLNLKNVGTVDPNISAFYSFDPKKTCILDLNVSTNICRFYIEYWVKSMIYRRLLPPNQVSQV
jgi:hypothetical protein